MPLATFKYKRSLIVHYLGRDLPQLHVSDYGRHPWSRLLYIGQFVIEGLENRPYDIYANYGPQFAEELLVLYRVRSNGSYISSRYAAYHEDEELDDEYHVSVAARHYVDEHWWALLTGA